MPLKIRDKRSYLKERIYCGRWGGKRWELQGNSIFRIAETVDVMISFWKSMNIGGHRWKLMSWGWVEVEEMWSLSLRPGKLRGSIRASFRRVSALMISTSTWSSKGPFSASLFFFKFYKKTIFRSNNMFKKPRSTMTLDIKTAEKLEVSGRLWYYTLQF